MTYNKPDNLKRELRSNNYLVVDIEVVPEKFEVSEIREYLMDKKFPRKIHPMFSRVIMIGFKLADNKSELLFMKDETELLTRFWTMIEKVHPDTIITFNGYNFDIPFIITRSHIKGVRPTMGINQTRWKMDNSNHFDCMQLLSANQTFLNVALDIACRVFEIPIPDGRFYGEEVPKLYDSGDLDAIKKHCRQDLELTEQLYLKLMR